MDDPEATQLILQTLFDIKVQVSEIHWAVLGGGDDEEENDS